MKSPISLFHTCHKYVEPKGAWAWEEAEKFEITPITTWFYSENPQSNYTFEDFFALVPPFRVTWLEHGMPETIREGNEVKHIFDSFDASIDYRKIKVGALILMSEENQDKDDDIRWLIHIGVYSAYGDEVFVPGDYSIHFGLDRLGNIGWLEKPTAFGPGVRAIKRTYEGPSSILGTVPDTLFHPFLYALQLLNCRNVSYATTKVNPKPKKIRRQIKVRKSESKPYQYHTLIIKPMRSRTTRDSDHHRKGKVGLHIRRGHFGDYREKGLFGKHHGIYYFGPAVVGSMDRVIEKDYQVRM